jgi:hypothetical protein
VIVFRCPDKVEVWIEATTVLQTSTFCPGNWIVVQFIKLRLAWFKSSLLTETEGVL